MISARDNKWAIIVRNYQEQSFAKHFSGSQACALRSELMFPISIINQSLSQIPSITPITPSPTATTTSGTVPTPLTPAALAVAVAVTVTVLTGPLAVDDDEEAASSSSLPQHPL